MSEPSNEDFPPATAETTRVEQHFDRLLEGEDIESVLAGEASPAIAVQVRKLWAHHQSATQVGFLAQPASFEIAPVFYVGQLLASRFEIQSLLGNGGMGEVYLAWDRKLGEKVAIKTIARMLSHSDQLRRRFLAEVQNARRVTHPNVCRIHDLFEEGATPFYSMDYLPGAPLSSLLSEARWTKAQRKQLIEQLAEALDAAHRSGVVHGDFKPANVMIVGHETLRGVVMDFGLACAFEKDSQGRAPKQSLEVGTFDFMAPELKAGGALSIASDIFAFGKVASLLCPGEALWESCVRESPDLRPATLAEVIRKLRPRVSRRQWAGGIALATAAGLTGLRMGVRPARTYIESGTRLFLNGFQSAVEQLPQAHLTRSLILAGLLQSPRLHAIADQDALPSLRLLAGQASLPVSGDTLRKLLTVKRATYWIEGRLSRTNGRYSLALSLLRVADGALLAAGAFRDLASLASLALQSTVWVRTLAGESARSLEINPASAASFTSSVPEALESYYAAMDQYAVGEMEQAIPLLQEAIRLDAEFAQAYSVLGMCLNSLQRSEDAMRNVERAYSLAKNLPEREKLWIELNYWQMAEDHLNMVAAARKSLQFYPDEPRFHRILAHTLCWTGKAEESLPFSRKCVELSPQNELNRSQLILNLTEAGHFAEAAAEYTNAVRAGLPHSQVSYAAAAAYLGLHEYQRAQSLALALPDDPSLYGLAARVLSGDFDSAQAYLQQKTASALSQQNATQHFAACTQSCGLYFLRGQTAEALAQLHQAPDMAETPGFARLLQAGAFWAGRLGDDALLSTASRKLMRIQQAWPNSFTRATCLYARALQAKRQNDSQEHISLLLESIGTAFTIWPFFDLPDAYQSTGRYDLAEEYWRKFEERKGTALRFWFSGLLPLAWIQRAKAAEARDDWKAARLYAGYVLDDLTEKNVRFKVVSEANRLVQLSQSHLRRNV